jgi:hypothetical protein
MVVWLLVLLYKVRIRLLWREQHWLQGNSCYGEMNSAWMIFECPTYMAKISTSGSILIM